MCPNICGLSYCSTSEHPALIYIHSPSFLGLIRSLPLAVLLHTMTHQLSCAKNPVVTKRFTTTLTKSSFITMGKASLFTERILKKTLTMKQKAVDCD